MDRGMQGVLFAVRRPFQEFAMSVLVFIVVLSTTACSKNAFKFMGGGQVDDPNVSPPAGPVFGGSDTGGPHTVSEASPGMAQGGRWPVTTTTNFSVENTTIGGSFQPKTATSANFSVQGGVSAGL